MLAKTIAAALSAAGLLACTLTARVSTPLTGTYDVDLKIDFQSGTVSVPASPEVPAGTCLTLTFYDDEGAPLGSANVTVGGGPVSAPAGTENLEVSSCEPEDQEDKIKPRDMQHFETQSLELFPYKLFPVDFTDGRGCAAAFTVTAKNRMQADALAHDFRAGMLVEPCPAFVTPHAIADVELLADGRVRYSIYSTSAPTSLDFHWNGAPLFTLVEASMTLLNGWYVATFHVPAGLVETPVLGVPAENAAFYELGTAQGTVHMETSLLVQL